LHGLYGIDYEGQRLGIGLLPVFQAVPRAWNILVLSCSIIDDLLPWTNPPGEFPVSMAGMPSAVATALQRHSETGRTLGDLADRGERPDSIRNGLALSTTVHWRFDRGLVSMDDDFSILIAKNRLPDPAKRLINEDWQLILPQRADLRPHRHYLGYHRGRIFKG